MLDEIFKITRLKSPESSQSQGEAGGGSARREEPAGRVGAAPRVRGRWILRKLCQQEESEATFGAAGVTRN